MTSLPVGATVRRAYGFAIRGFLRNLAVAWLPGVLLAALLAFSLPRLLAALAQFAHGLAHVSDPHRDVIVLATGVAVIMRYGLLIAVGSLFFRAQIMTGLTQRALGQKAGIAGAYFSLGATFWRVFGAYLLIFLLLMAVQLVASLLLVLPTIILVGIGHSATRGGAVVAFFALWRLALFVVVSYLFIRLAFVVTAVIVAEKRFDLIHPWRLVGGNVLRIFAVGLVIFVPLVLVLGVIYALVLGPAIWSLVLSLAHAHLYGRQLAVALIQDISGGLTQLLARRWFILLPFALLSVTLEYGLAAGAGVAGYQFFVAGADQAEAPFPSLSSPGEPVP